MKSCCFPLLPHEHHIYNREKVCEIHYHFEYLMFQSL